MIQALRLSKGSLAMRSLPTEGKNKQHEIQNFSDLNLSCNVYTHGKGFYKRFALRKTKSKENEVDMKQ